MPSGRIPLEIVGGDSTIQLNAELRWYSHLRTDGSSYTGEIKVDLCYAYTGTKYSGSILENIYDGNGGKGARSTLTVKNSTGQVKTGKVLLSEASLNRDWYSSDYPGDVFDFPMGNNQVILDKVRNSFQVTITVDPFWLTLLGKKAQFSANATVDIGPSLTIEGSGAFPLAEPVYTTYTCYLYQERMQMFLSKTGKFGEGASWPLGETTISCMLRSGQELIEMTTARYITIPYEILNQRELVGPDEREPELYLCFGNESMCYTRKIVLEIPENNVTKPRVLGTFQGWIGEGSELNGPIIRGKSRLRGELSGESDYSEMRSFSMSAFGQTVSQDGERAALYLDTDTYPGTHSVTVTAVDARGFTATSQYSVVVQPYQKPRVVPKTGFSEVLVQRVNASGVPTGAGDQLKITAGRQFTTIVEKGKSYNSCALAWRWRISGGQWQSWGELLANTASDQGISTVILSPIFPVGSSYEVELRALDGLGESHVLLFKISTEDKSFSLLCSRTGAAFGKKAEFPDVVEIAPQMTLWIRGKLKVDGSGWKTLQAREDSSVWESIHPVGKRPDSGVSYLVENGNHVHIAFNRAFRWIGNQIFLNLTALPEELRPGCPVSSICPTEGGAAVCTVDCDGMISIQGILGSAEQNFPWLDGYLDYWMEGS